MRFIRGSIAAQIQTNANACSGAISDTFARANVADQDIDDCRNGSSYSQHSAEETLRH
jgi:hypothetical protein